MGLNLDDAVIQIRLGGYYDGTAPNFTGGGFDFLFRAKSFRITDEGEKTNVKGAGQKRKKHRYHSPGAVAMLRGLLQDSGNMWIFKQAIGPRPMFRWIEITTCPSSRLATPETQFGVITKWEWSGDEGEAQVEEIEVDLDPDYVEA